MGISIKELMAFLNPLGANVRNHMSTIDDKFVDEARTAFSTASKSGSDPSAVKATEAQSGPKNEVTKPKTFDKGPASEGGALRKSLSATEHPAADAVAVNNTKQGAAQPKATPNLREKEALSRNEAPRRDVPHHDAPSKAAPQNVQQQNPAQRVEQPGRMNNSSSRVSPMNHLRNAGNNQEQKPAAISNRPASQGDNSGLHANRRPAEPSKQVGPASKFEPARTNPQGNQNHTNSGIRPQQSSGQRPGPSQAPRMAQRPNQGPSRPGQNQGPYRPGQNQGPYRPGQNQGPSRPGQNHGPSRPGQNQGPSRPGQNQGTRQNPNFGQKNGHGNLGARQQEGRNQFGARNGMHASNNQNSRGQQSRFQENRIQTPSKPQTPTTSVKSVQLPDFMSIKEFSQLVELPASDIIKKLIGLGVMATINQEIDRDTMILIADEYGITASAAKTEAEKLEFVEAKDDPSTLMNRPPVVTILGHVDHGKTSLLDAIRQTNVTSQEAGGITQHIGAYQVELKERKITFLDTPGHAAFTAMRARGAQVTDIAILVVAADDGVMPQTVEAINHVQDANVPIIVAINKIDKPGANLDRIKTDLMQYGLVDEALGGETIFVPVSAKKRTGIETLLEMILLMADVKDLKANPERLAKGTIIEAKLDKGRGPVATVLVQNGTLQVGDPIIAGAAAGKVKVLNNDKGKRVKKAGPSTPVEVIGFDEVPEAGDILHVAAEEHSARQLADKRMQYKRETELKKTQKITLDDLFTKIKEGEIKELKIVLKADVQGSVEAIRQSLEKLSSEEVRVKVIQGAVGGIGEGDVMLASASNAIIIGFNVRPDPSAKRSADKENVDIRLYRVIYNIIEDVQKAMEGMLEPTFKEVINGKAEIRQVYKVPKVGNVAGCYVLEGKITRSNDIRLIRDNIVILEGKIDSLKRFKDDVREVLEGFECGIGIEKYNDIKEGDIIEAFSLEEVKRTIAK